MELSINQDKMNVDNFLAEMSQWQLAVIVFMTQMIFLWFRTLNVIYTSEKKLWPSILTGLGIGASWLIAVSIGVNAIMQVQILPVLGHLLGGAIGTYIGMVKNLKK